MGSVGTASTGGVGLAWSEEALQPHWSGFGPAQTLSEQDKADELIEGVSVDYAPAAASATPVDTWTFCFYSNQGEFSVIDFIQDSRSSLARD